MPTCIGHDLCRFGRETRGVAAIEFALLSFLFITGLFNAFDIARYAYQRVQVSDAAYAGAQAAWKTCNDQTTMLPATKNCPGLTAAVTSSIQSTSLGTSVSLISTGIAEGYYCVNSSNTLQFVGSISSKPANCSAAGNANASPGDYIQIGVTYNYKPMFPASVMSLRGSAPITQTSWMRLG